MKIPVYEIKDCNLETVEDMINALMQVPKNYRLHPLGQKCAIAVDHYHECVYLDDPNWIDGYEDELKEDVEESMIEVPDKKLETYNLCKEKG